MLSRLNEPHLSNFLIAEDKNGNYIKYEDKVSFAGHIGEIRYNFKNCRFVIVWEDGHERSLTSDFAKELEIL